MQMCRWGLPNRSLNELFHFLRGERTGSELTDIGSKESWKSGVKIYSFEWELYFKSGWSIELICQWIQLWIPIMLVLEFNEIFYELGLDWAGPTWKYLPNRCGRQSCISLYWWMMMSIFNFFFYYWFTSLKSNLL